jgi:hypothetical protein
MGQEQEQEQAQRKAPESESEQHKGFLKRQIYSESTCAKRITFSTWSLLGRRCWSNVSVMTI